MRTLSVPLVMLFGLVLAVALVLALFPAFPRQLGVQEGDVASRTLLSPRDVTFESALLTEQEREAAANAVPSVEVFNPNVQSQQLETLAETTASVGQVRKDSTLNSAARRAQLLEIVSRDSVDTVLALTDSRWQRVATEAELVLGDVTNQSVRPDNVQAEQEGLLLQISPDLSAGEANLVADLVRPLIIPTVEVDEEATNEAREAAKQNVAPALKTISENDIIVREGETVQATTLEELERVGLLRPTVEWDTVLAVVIISVLVASLVALYLWLFPTAAITSVRNLLLLALMIAVPVLLAKVYFSLVLPDDDRRFLAYFLPLAAAPMLVATLLEARLAVVVGLVQAVLMTFAMVYLPDPLESTLQPLEAGQVLLVYGLGSVMGVLAVYRAERPDQYVLGGVLVGGVALAGLFAFWLLDPDRRAFDAAWMATAASVNGLASGVLTAGGFAAVGALFGVTTRAQLIELSQLNAPLLRRLQDEAPGTFHHSIIVANLAERAADLIGADALLVRVGCYYHDIGKALQPGYYIENQLGGDNPHDGLDHQSSARIIQQHVRGGMELARRHGLPPRVQAFIPEHHGTRLIAYFYRVASQDDPEVDPDLFRYPGPKPQSRETAVVMLADSTEAMVRASADRSSERIEAIVEEVLAERMAEGELEECDLTMRDMRTIAESFKGTMRAVYHPRVEYPEPTPQERRALIGRFRPGRRAAPPLPEAPSPWQGQGPTW